MTDRLVLVTGAAGFMGSSLVRRLLADGFMVRAIDRKPYEGPSHDRLDAQVVDIRDQDALRSVLTGVDTIFHLASMHLEVHADTEAFRATNVTAVGEFVRLAADAGVRRFLHTSSVGVFGHVAHAPAAEDAPKNPQTDYETSKLAGEEIALKTAAEVGIDLIVIRPAWVYGPGCPRTGKLLKSLRKRQFFFVGKGANLRHPIFIDDMNDGYIAAANAPSAYSGRVYIMAGPRWLTLQEMVQTFVTVGHTPKPIIKMPFWMGRFVAWGAERAFALVGRDPPFSHRSLAFFENDNAFDTKAAEHDLGFVAATDLADGLRRTLAN